MYFLLLCEKVRERFKFKKQKIESTFLIDVKTNLNIHLIIFS